VKGTKQRGTQAGDHGRHRRDPRQAKLADGEVEHLPHQPDQAQGEQHPEPDAERRSDQAEESRLGEDRACDHPPGGAQGAEHAELPHPLEDGHVERVEDQEPADEQRHRGEEVEDGVEGLELGLHLVAFRRRGQHPDPLPELPVEPIPHPINRLGAPVDDDVDLVERARLLKQPARLAERERAEALAAEVEPGGELEQADDAGAGEPRRGRERHAVADGEVLRVRPALLEHDLLAAARAPARDGLGVGEIRRIRSLARDVELRRALIGSPAEAVDDAEHGRDPALGVLHLAGVADPAQRGVR
jgi:hypothetical protein